MKRLTVITLVALAAIYALALAAPAPALAQSSTPVPTPQPLTIFTTYPSQTIGFGETVTVSLTLRAGTPQLARLEVQNLPAGWTASFRGGSRIVDAVYLDGSSDGSIDLRLEPPADLKAGSYQMKVVSTGEGQKSEMALSFTVKEKLPPRLSLTTNDLPTRTGTPSSTFNFSVNLKNEGGEDLQVVLSADQPKNMQVSFESGGQTVTQLKLAANETRSINVKAQPLTTLEAGSYTFTARASAGDVKAEIQLTAEVKGEGTLSITTPDGRLSGEAYAGSETPLKITLSNTGTAPLKGISLSSSGTSGWTITFDQQQIPEIAAGKSVEVTVKIKPPDKAVAGDYMLTINAQPLDTASKSAEFRITVLTSTLWGVIGIVLIAAAVVVVGLAVARFGRR